MRDYRQKLIFLIIILILIVFIISGCSRPFLIPGAQKRITIWQEEENLIKVYFSSKVSADRNNEGHLVSGNISTDGSFEFTGFNLNELDSVNASNSEIDFEIYLNNDDYYKGIDLTVTGYSYLEFEIKFDGHYRRDLISLGTYLNRPEDNIFRIYNKYLSDIKKAPLYGKRPVSTLVGRFLSDRVFALSYFIIIILLISGIIVTSIKIRNSR